MKERPILFSAPMVRALLAGSKTQTRRAVKSIGNDGGFVLLDHGNGWWPYRSDDGESSFHTVRRGGKLYLEETPHACPYGMLGDRLWVREAWKVSSAHNDLSPRDIPVGDGIEYGADAERILTGKLRPSMFMPRWASRITLEVVSVRVERLNDISAEDCIAEGLSTNLREHDAVVDLKDQYQALWESLNGAGSWAANPWVWVVELRMIKR